MVKYSHIKEKGYSYKYIYIYIYINIYISFRKKALGKDNVLKCKR